MNWALKDDKNPRLEEEGFWVPGGVQSCCGDSCGLP
jgi:hypothetical protein